MIKMLVKYEDLEGNEKQTEAYFHLTEAEWVKIEIGVKGGLSVAMQKALADQDVDQQVRLFDILVSSAYGQRSPDNVNRFVKSSELYQEFVETGAYSGFLMELIHDEDKLVNFVKSLVPKKILDQLPA